MLHTAQATHEVHRQIQLLQALTAWRQQNKNLSVAKMMLGWLIPSSLTIKPRSSAY